MKKYIHIFLCVLVLTAGCSKKKNTNPSIKSVSPKKSYNKNNSFNDNLEAFALDDDTLHNFAHEQQSHKESSSLSHKPNSIFQWEDVTADQSKSEFRTIYFDFDKYKITKEQESALQSDIEHAKKMIALGKVIVIEGHACDSAGSAAYNMVLSEKRAKFIATKFNDAGVEKAHIKIAARGQEMPVHKGGNKHEQAVNRRVEVFAIDTK